MKTLKTSLVLFSTVFVLAACGQNNSAQTTQAAQETTQANNKQSKLNPATNNQSQEKTEENQQNKEKATNNQQNKKKSNQQNNTNSNQQNNSNLPKDGEAVYKLEKNGVTTSIKYYFKDDIVYQQDAVFAFNPKEMGKTEEEVQQIVKKRHSIYNGVKGFESNIARKDGIYYHTLKINYNNIDWKELHKRDPETHPSENPPALKYSDAVKARLEEGYVKQ